MSFQCMRDVMYGCIALVGLFQGGVDEVTIWACNALGNLATAGQNRISIIRSGGVSMLLGPCNSADAELAVLNHQELCFFCVEKVIQVWWCGGVVI